MAEILLPVTADIISVVANQEDDFGFDGIVDIIAASGGNNHSTVNIYSGADHHVIRTFTAIPNSPNSSLFTAGTFITPVYRPTS